MATTTESAIFEVVITQQLFELQPYGLTCVVILTCGFTGKIVVYIYIYIYIYNIYIYMYIYIVLRILSPTQNSFFTNQPIFIVTPGTKLPHHCVNTTN